MDEVDRQCLIIEARWYRYGGAKVRDIRADLGLSPTQFYQRLNRLIRDPEAAAEFPVVVARLARMIEARAPYRRSA